MISIYMTGLPGAAHAEVISAEPGGFVIGFDVRIADTPARVYEALVSEPARWWHPSHTFSGDAGNLSIEPEAGGCFCEALEGGGSVRHMEIVLAAPGETLRMQGGLGPLRGLAVAGSMSWQLREEEGGTHVELRYNVGGYLPDGLDAWARPVDSVLDEQLRWLKNYVESGDPGVAAATG